MTMKFSSKVAVACGLIAGFQLISFNALARGVLEYIDQEGYSTADAYKSAKSDCGGNTSCEAQIPRDLLKRGITATDIMIAAVASGADPAYVVKVFSKAAMKAGVSMERITSALVTLTKVENSGFTEASVVSGLSSAVEETPGDSYTQESVVYAARSAGVTSSNIIDGIVSAGNGSKSEVAQLLGVNVNDLPSTAAGDDGDNTTFEDATAAAADEIGSEIVTGGASPADTNT